MAAATNGVPHDTTNGTTNGHSQGFSIAIVGGGIGGICCAIALRQQGVSCQIYEAASAFAEIGAGVSFGPNAQHAMRLISPGLLAAFETCKTNNARVENREIWFQFRNGQDLAAGRVGSSIFDLHSPTGQSSVHRAKYLDEIIKLVPSEIAHFGKRLDSIDDNGERVVLHFQDGSSATHSAVIACDGVKSRARKILLGEDDPAASPQFTGKYAYRGLIPMDEAAKVLGDDIARNSQNWLGHGGHLLMFPVEKGKTLNVVAFSTKADGKWDDEQWVKPMNKSDMYADFSDWVPSVHDILSLMQKPDVWALFDHPPAHTYTRGRICLLGDSAHASTPHQGAGAGMAIEDALVMGAVMGLVRDGRSDVEKAFAAYDTIRRPRSQRLVTTSREQGLLYDMQMPGVGDDLEKMRYHLSTGRKWIWEFDLEAHVQEAVDLMKESLAT